MSQTFMLAHLSDPHLGPMPVFWPWHWNMKRAFGYANWMRKRRSRQLPSLASLIADDVRTQGVDHIAISGDLTNIGMPAEYRKALAWLQYVGPPERVSTVPGNHDIYCRLWFDRGIGRWADYMSSTEQGQDDKCLPGAHAHGVIFPFVRVWGNIALIGVNSAFPTATGSAAGHVGDTQRLRLEGILKKLNEQRMCRVVMVHHPPLPGQARPIRALRDSDLLESVLTKVGAELVIHGHNHKPMLEYREWQGRRFPVVGVSSCSAAVTLSAPAAYNIYVITPVADNSYRIELIERQVAPDAASVHEVRRKLLTLHI
ncbi:MAG: metallophosphoesterase [Pseudomonadota bacterium]